MKRGCQQEDASRTITCQGVSGFLEIGAILDRSQLYPFKSPKYTRYKSISYEYCDDDVRIFIKAPILNTHVTLRTEYSCGVVIPHISCYSYGEAIDTFRMLTSSFAKYRATILILCKSMEDAASAHYKSQIFNNRIL